MIRVFRPFVLIMMDFCGFLQGKSSEVAWIPEIPYTMHPAKQVSKTNFATESAPLAPSFLRVFPCLYQSQ